MGALIPGSGNSLPPGRIQNTCEAQHYVLAGIRGRLRMPGGTVRVNRPWLLSTGLSRALAGVFATAAFGIVSTDIWRVTLYTGPLRDAVVTLLSITTLGSAIARQQAKPAQPRHRDCLVHRHHLPLRHAVRARPCHRGVRTPKLRPAVVAPARCRAHLSLAPFISSMGTVGGALGARWEEDRAVGRPPTGSVRGRVSARTRTGPPPADASRGPRCGPGCPSFPGARARAGLQWHPHRSPRPPV